MPNPTYETLNIGGHSRLVSDIFTKIRDRYASVAYVVSHTTAEWNQLTSLQSRKDCLYIYTDHQVKDGDNIPGLKIGDGNAFVVDLPFLDDIYSSHIADQIAHVTSADRTFWDNKVTCYIDPNQNDKLIFSKN